MNRLFQVTVYTGQQLVLEALQRWLQRPCSEPDVQRQRRASIKSLIVLLLKTAATGMLATILDAAIEYRRRQLLAAAEEEPGSSSPPPSRLRSLGLGPLSRAGIAAWKARLLIAIDEMESTAQQYGIEPTRRFTPEQAQGKQLDANAPLDALEGSKTGTAAATAAAAAAALSESADPERQAALAATVEQLQQLAKLGGEDGLEDAERNFEEQVDSLLDSLLGVEPSPTAISEGLKASSSSSRLAISRSTTDMTTIATVDAITNTKSSTAMHKSPLICDGTPDQVCHICMDRSIGVQVLGCSHELCFQCARRLCATQDHSLPQCPFCRQPINGFAAFSAPVGTTL